MYTRLIRPLLFQFSPETAHKLTFTALQSLQVIPGLLPLYEYLHAHSQPVRLMGLNFRNRVGVAAGLDKNAALIHAWKALGFGFTEIGTVTPLPQKGNRKPRLFRLIKDQALINRMGFNNEGLKCIANRLQHRPANYIVGGNIGKNTATPNHKAVEDYLLVFNGLYPFVDYLVVNVSCPNITNLNELQDKAALQDILQTLMLQRSKKSVRKPVLLKISPDLNNAQLHDSLQIVSDLNLDGIIATNTTVSRNNITTGSVKLKEIGSGGLSGRPLSKLSTAIIARVRREMGDDFPVIGTGGIMSVDDARAKLDAGANLLQLYTGFIYKGVSLVNKCKRF